MEIAENATPTKTSLQRENTLLTGQARVLEMIAAGAPLEETLTALVHFIEAQEDDLRCTILVVGDDGAHLTHSIGPNAPAAFHEMLHDVPIAPPYVGSCSETTHLGHRVSVPDVAADERYSEDWRKLMLACGLKAVCSLPVRAADGRVLASFAMHRTRPRDPSPAHPELIDIATHLTGIALERHDFERTIRRNEREQRELLDALPVAVYRTDAAGKITYYNKASVEFAGRAGCEPKIGSDEWCVTWRLHRPDGAFLPHNECPMAVALKENRAILGAEAAAERPDGTRVPFLAFPVPLTDESGKVLGAVNTLVDIGQLKQTEKALQAQTQRLKALNRVSQVLSRDLDLERIMQNMTDSATELSGAQYGSFFYNVADDNGESYMLYTLSGAPVDAFADSAMPRNTTLFQPTFAGTEIIRLDNVRDDPRFGDNEPYHGLPDGHLPVVSYLAVPVISRTGEVLGGLFFGHEEPGVFTQDAEDLVAGIAAHAALAIDNARLFKEAQTEIAERRAADEHRQLLLREVNHRAKNMLHTVQSIAVQTRRTAASPGAFEEAFLARLHSLSQTHDLLSEGNWRGAALHELISRELAPYQINDETHCTLDGDAVQLDAKTALALGMAFHELATNAAKYGALSTPSGHIYVNWRLKGRTAAPEQLHLDWMERGGPSVEEPKQRGFGSRLIESGLAYELRADVQLQFDADGVRCTIDMPLKPHRKPENQRA